jgi:hypothetical protein
MLTVYVANVPDMAKQSANSHEQSQVVPSPLSGLPKTFLLYVGIHTVQ